MESDQVRGTVLAGALLMSLIGGSTDSPSDCCLLLDTRNVSSCLSADTLKARAAAMLLWKRTFRIRVLAASGSHSTAKEVCVRCLSQGWHTGLATNTTHSTDRALLTVTAHSRQPGRLCPGGGCRRCVGRKRRGMPSRVFSKRVDTVNLTRLSCSGFLLHSSG